ncbi:transglutaminase family protein [Rathayibacter sp. KR2-224]|uniref:transglutaminase family protein n=1 Tax=Rathayibacter sp. KR2-224 TaxID=3400913 RepID=UPI003C07D040
MKRLKVVHTTGFRYAGDVTASYNEARMLPIGGDGQLVLSAQLDVTPGGKQFGYVDYWGTQVTAFEVITPHDELTLTATSFVEVAPRMRPASPADWRTVARAGAMAVAYAEQTRQTPRTLPDDDLLELAREVTKRTHAPDPAALLICDSISEAMEYLPGSTGVYSTAAEAWEKRSGVCQDIAHVALGALRSVGIPARYVSGYLHPDPDPVIGKTVTGESHAWVEWFCGSWRGYDPTNRIEIGDRHVLVGRGRDYDDVAPIRGVYAGPSESEQFVSVEITRVS